MVGTTDRFLTTALLLTLLKAVYVGSLKTAGAVKHLTLFSIYTHFHTLKKKALESDCGQREIAHMSNFTFFHNVFYGICIFRSFNRIMSPFSTMFSMESVSSDPLIATFWLLSAASLNLRGS